MTQLFEGWWTLIKFPLKIVPILHLEHLKCKIFPGPWSGPHSCRKGFSHACSIVDRFAPPPWKNGRAVSPYPTPLHFRGVGTQYQMSPVCRVSGPPLSWNSCFALCKTKPCVPSLPSILGLGGGGHTMFPSFDNSCVLMLLSHLGEYLRMNLKFAMNSPKCCDLIVNNVLGRP